MKHLLPLIKGFLWLWAIISFGALMYFWAVVGIGFLGLLPSFHFRGTWRDILLPTMLLLLLIAGNVYALRSASRQDLNWNTRLDRLLLFLAVDLFLTLWVIPATAIYIDSFGLIVMILIAIALTHVKMLMLPHEPVAPAGR